MELETDLEKERRKLGELRKQHYQLAGEAEGWEVVRYAPFFLFHPTPPLFEQGVCVCVCGEICAVR